MKSDNKSILFILSALVAGGLLISTTARAACGDPPVPGVDWTGCAKDGADLSGADLRDIVLVGASFIGANLVAANVHGANLVDVNLSGANRTGAILQKSE